jgi:hypothetical protein
MGMGPATAAPVLLAFTTISAEDLSRILLSNDFNFILILVVM